MNNVSFAKQTHVYFKKIFRISLREKVWKFIIFAAIIGGIVAWVLSEKMFGRYMDTQSGFFTLASACIWLGIFNSIQSICKEHDIIRSEYRQGMKLSSYVFANVLFQAVLCLVQAIIVFGICFATGFFTNNGGPSDGSIMPALVEYFITIYLLTLGSAIMGLMVSSISGNPTTAMTIMPFVLILQLVMCGVLFPLGEAADFISFITFSKWGMSAFGSTCGLNTIPEKITVNGISNQYTPNPKDFYTHDAGTLLIAWGCIIGIAVVFAVISVISLKIKNRDS